MLVLRLNMKSGNITEHGNLLKVLPPVDFCCVYGSTLHPNNCDKVFLLPRLSLFSEGWPKQANPASVA